MKEKFINYFKTLPKRYFITAFSGMAQGLFVTLIAGTILDQIGGWIGDNYVGSVLKTIAAIAKTLMGAGIGVGIAHALGKNKLLVFSAAVAGMIGAFADKLLPGAGEFALKLGAPGNPIGAYVVTMLCVEIVGLYAGKTKLDIILVPFGVMILAFGGVFVAFPFIWLVNQLGSLISIATNATPFVMGNSDCGNNGNSAYDAHFFGGYLDCGCNAGVKLKPTRFGCVRRNAACRWRGYCRLRMPYGWVCRRFLSRERIWRSCRSGHRNQYAANS